MQCSGAPVVGAPLFVAKCCRTFSATVTTTGHVTAAIFRRRTFAATFGLT